MSKTSYTLLLTLAVPLIININFVLRLWLGGEVPEHTAILSILVIISVMINCLHTPITQVIHATGVIKQFQIGTSLIITGIIPISWIVLKLGGSAAACYWVCIFIYLVNQIYAMYALKKSFPYKISEYIKEVIVKCLVITLILPVITAILSFVTGNEFMSLIISCVVSCIVSIFLYLYVMIDKGERNAIFKLVQSRIRFR